jgi:hypothetical protein
MRRRHYTNPENISKPSAAEAAAALRSCRRPWRYVIEYRVAESRAQYRLISWQAHRQMIALPPLACLLAEALAAKPMVAEPLTTAREAFCGSIVATRR